MNFLDKCDRNTDGKLLQLLMQQAYTQHTHLQTGVVRYFLEDIHPRFNIPFNLESIDFILKNNTFAFANEYSLQGTAMGTVLAPTYINLSMGYHEIELYDLIESNYNLNIRQYFVENQIRFIDDCQIILNTNLIKPDDLLTIVNSVNNDI